MQGIVPSNCSLEVLKGGRISERGKCRLAQVGDRKFDPVFGQAVIGFNVEIPVLRFREPIRHVDRYPEGFTPIGYRVGASDSILATQPEGKEWVIEGAGRARYRFALVPINRIVPNRDLITIKIPDATPEIIGSYALNDEQALLAKVRYNRLIDIFLGVTAYSLQNHLRTTVKGVGQIEIDEIYVGIDRHGAQYVVPVQAKGGTDQLSVVQAKQDIACCAEKFPHLICRSISAQFMDDERIAIFELTVQDDQVKIVQERHYKLVSGKVPLDELAVYRRSA